VRRVLLVEVLAVAIAMAVVPLRVVYHVCVPVGGWKYACSRAYMRVDSYLAASSCKLSPETKANQFGHACDSGTFDQDRTMLVIRASFRACS
jgi:hypothetical protein